MGTHLDLSSIELLRGGSTVSLHECGSESGLRVGLRRGAQVETSRHMFPLCHFPELSFAKSLLIKGEYHPSAPIHFCISHLSHVSEEGTAVFITPSKESFVQTLVAYNDRWLGKYGGIGETAAKLSRVKVLFVSGTLRTMHMWII